ncbi:MAG: cadherin-like beta sandwich domain-containing protein, partial [Gammaproteobacteria bacterium]|nr:cadherin-like beta sandwich domain-containing protein [Gammaproteobacteria bacterium]
MTRLARLVLLLLVLLSGCDSYDPDATAAYLADLGITGYQLEPAFSSSTFDYVATIPPGTDSITVEVASTHQGATVTVNGILVESDGGSITLQLAALTNTIKVVVLSPDKMRTQTYTVIVSKQLLSYAVGGTVSGLTGDLTLQNNAGDDLAIAGDGAFEFAIPVTDGDDYAVTVSAQPAGQTCSVTNGSGTIDAADVSDVSVNCVDDVAQTYTVGGSVGGLSGSMTLQNNGADDLIVNAIGSFSFATAMADGAAYAVTVSSQPAGQLCIVSNGAGTISGANVINVSVSCSAIVVPTYTVGGTVSGLTGNATLQNNGADDLPIAADGPFAFSTALIDGSTYAVTVSAQPDGQTCTVSNASGTVSGANVSNVGVTCVDNVVPTYFVRITVSGLTGSMRLQNNGGDDLIVSSNGPNAFATALDDGSAYAVTVSVQPDGQTCTVTNGSGIIAGADVADISVNCADNIV